MSEANQKQIGGDHYKGRPVEPWDFIEEHDIPFLEACAIKYLTRWKNKGGLADLDKAVHFMEKVLEIKIEKPERTGPGVLSDLAKGTFLQEDLAWRNLSLRDYCTGNGLDTVAQDLVGRIYNWESERQLKAIIDGLKMYRQTNSQSDT
jgi:hypothetical protein